MSRFSEDMLLWKLYPHSEQHKLQRRRLSEESLKAAVKSPPTETFISKLFTDATVLKPRNFYWLTESNKMNKRLQTVCPKSY